MTASVLQLHQQPNPRAAGPKHDNLHMKEGLRFCWCLCQRCFMRYGTGGVCICRDCPCAAHFNSRSPMYASRTPTGDSNAR